MMTSGLRSREENGLLRRMKYALTELGAAASIMELVSPQMNANVRLDGQG